MESKSNKTIISAILFLDIVEYSKRAVADQISLKERFNAFLSIAIRDVPVADRIILDTGDGAAISFLGDIEDALRVALSVRSSLLGEGVRMEPPLLVRMGINLGPVRLVRDINNQPNLVGDGINVAQRIMGFAAPGQILVSRSYFDAVSRLSREYAGMFHYQGIRTDKHVREHEVYAIGYPEDLTSTQRSVLLQHESKKSVSYERVLKQAKHCWAAFVDKVVKAQRKVKVRSVQVSGPQQTLLVAVVGMLLVGMASSLFWVKQWSNVKPDAARPQIVTDSAPLVNSGVSEKDAPHPSASVAMPSPLPSPSASSPSPSSQSPSSPSPSLPSSPLTPQKEGTPSKSPLLKKSLSENEKIPEGKERVRSRSSEEAVTNPARVSLVILPWGEVYLDGKKQGVSPPLRELRIGPGRHTIEIRNTTFPVYRKKILVEAGTKITIRHSFDQVP